LIRNPSVQVFIQELKEEEKYHSEKYWEAIRYNVVQKGNESLKRNISMLPQNIPIVSFQTEQVSFPAKKIQKGKLSPAFNFFIPLELLKNEVTNYIKFLRSNGRIITVGLTYFFAAIIYFIFYYDLMSSFLHLFQVLLRQLKFNLRTINSRN